MKITTGAELRAIVLRNRLLGHLPRDADEREALTEAFDELLKEATAALRGAPPGVPKIPFPHARRYFEARRGENGQVLVMHAGNLLVFSARGVLQ